MYIDVTKLYCINGVYKSPKNIQIQDHIETYKGLVTVDSSYDVLTNQDIVKVSTVFEDFFFKKSDKILSKHLYDFDETIPENNVSSLKEGDYVFIKKIQRPIKNTILRFNLKPHLFLGKLDYQKIDRSKFNIKPQLLQSILLHGEYNSERPVLDQDVHTYKECFLKTHSKTVKPTLLINKSFLSLVALCLRGHFYIDTDYTLTLVLDAVPEPLRQNIVEIIQNISVSFEYKDGVLVTKSRVMISLFNSFFDLDEILPYLSDKDSHVLFEFLSNQKSFVIPSKKIAKAFKDFLYRLNYLSNFVSLDNGQSLLLITDPSSYIELEEGYLLPISNISEPTEVLLQIKT